MSKINGVDHDEEEEEEEEDWDDEEEEEFKTELTEKFSKLLDELEDCNGNEQRKKIDEMNIKKKLYLNEMTDVIKYHQECGNLTQLAYQCAWEFLINGLYYEEKLESVVDELHFVREAQSEMNELKKCIDCEKKEHEKEKERNEMKEELILTGWLEVLEIYLSSCNSRNEKIIEVIRSVIQVLRAAKDNHGDIYRQCIQSLGTAARNRDIQIDGLLKSGAVNVFLEKVQQITIEDSNAFSFSRTSPLPSQGEPSIPISHIWNETSSESQKDQLSAHLAKPKGKTDESTEKEVCKESSTSVGETSASALPEDLPTASQE
ncbi:uncharacterized protein MONOS_8840 [Monocercomonoides exilis]|uniref:uncharacterized protein n=1 Tax=Monocercomonoides exilis TaxID=2049356 RepID=UPI00355A4A6C|nr:hypothetical protein MONOS_8840 [Monocercomonoides exilis]|eukprot:MONOS_8840.1-p1 / transcript=MONOS_8840.1 / gene=MONOS_8840 / organism=Monocercomonoides_exilis_PA203 / gene_product=unspecified product / transcript_product=unspecified product / location=Mono_scaffold00345:4004-6109(+) / protein_length=318 / sequence_SO=supercontig / SO=protein_coding / is_pseudo=false